MKKNITSDSQIVEEIPTKVVSESIGGVVEALISSSGIPFSNVIGIIASSASSTVAENVIDEFNQKTDGTKIDAGIFQRAATTAEEAVGIVGNNLQKLFSGEETNLSADAEAFMKRHGPDDADLKKLKEFAVAFGTDLVSGAAVAAAATAMVATAPASIPAAAIAIPASIFANIVMKAIFSAVGDEVGKNVEEVSRCNVGELASKAVDDVGKTFDSTKHSVENALCKLTGFGEDTGKHATPSLEGKHVERHPSHHSFVEDVANHNRGNHGDSNARG